jgi:hypothetical protein
MKGNVRGVNPLKKAVVSLILAEPASRQVPHALRTGEGVEGGRPPPRRGPFWPGHSLKTASLCAGHCHRHFDGWSAVAPFKRNMRLEAELATWQAG